MAFWMPIFMGTADKHTISQTLENIILYSHKKMEGKKCKIRPRKTSPVLFIFVEKLVFYQETFITY